MALTELILVKPVRKLGNVGQIVKVAMGYGRNYLMPKKLAIRSTEENKKHILQNKADLEKQSASLKSLAESNIGAYANKNFTFIKTCSYEGNLYGSLSTKEIAEHISTESFVVKSDNIHLSSPIKKTGSFEAIVSLHPEVECKIFLHVAKNQDEADKMLVSNLPGEES
jgi:large subunit ribosomal protein L9